jgi:hypothetical protein
MNHHADKLVEVTNLADEAAVDPALAGIVEEIHTCPACGAEAARRIGSKRSSAP